MWSDSNHIPSQIIIFGLILGLTLFLPKVQTLGHIIDLSIVVATTSARSWVQSSV